MSEHEAGEDTGRAQVPMMAIGADPHVVAALVASTLLAKALLHAETAKIEAALHCDDSRQMMAYAVMLLHRAGLLGPDHVLESIFEKLGATGLNFVAEHRPEWLAGLVAIPHGTDCKLTSVAIDKDAN